MLRVHLSQMKLVLSFIAGLLLVNSDAHAQKELTKEEIIQYWKVDSAAYKRSLAIVNSDSIVNAGMVSFIDSLQSKGIDSVIVYSISYIGSVMELNCYAGIFPTDVFVVWKKMAVTYCKQFKGCYLSEIVKGEGTDLFDFYAAHRQKLATERFMPVIMGARVEGDKRVFIHHYISHEECYSFFYKKGDERRSFHFSRSMIEDKQSLFYQDNLDLAAYEWWKMMGKEIGK